MAFNAQAILSDITNDPNVARNHHFHAVPELVKDIKEHENVASLIKAANDGVEDENFNMMLDTVNEKRLILEGFYAKWPAPVIEEIKDAVDIQSKVPVEWWDLPLMQSRPCIPLTVMNDANTSGTLFYKDEVSGDIFKVPNISYNQPDNARKICWEF